MNDRGIEERLPAPWGHRLDRGKTVGFYFDDRPFRGFAGDTVASALWANGEKVLSRSFKYHRPRGPLTLAGLDGHTLVQIGDTPNARADLVPIEPGLEVSAQNVFGTLRRDAARVFDPLGRFLPVGFYYKAFFKPRGAWRRWEPIIRRLAGLGRVDTAAVHAPTDSEYLFADVAVIGAGPAGLAAAAAAAEAGAAVVLVEREPELGGAATYRRDGDAAALTDALAGHASVRIMTGTTCTGWFADNYLTLDGGERFYNLRARAVVLAAGELDQPAVFRGNDLPGIVLGSAAQRLLRHYGVKPGERAVVLAADDRGYEVALDLREAGIPVALVDPRETPQDRSLSVAVANSDVRVFAGFGVVEAHSGARGALASVSVARRRPGGFTDGPHERLSADVLAVCAGAIPSAQLVCHSGGRLTFDGARSNLAVTLPAELERGFLAGAVNGNLDFAGAVEDGRRAGGRAAAAAGIAAPAVAPDVPVPVPRRVGETLFPHPAGRDFIDFDEDIQVKDIRRAVAEGYDDLDLVKRYSTAVMGQSQGKQSALNNLKIATVAAGRSLDAVSLTTQRPPFFPETIARLAGRPFDPVRRTALDAAHRAQGACMMPAGAWLRPAWYGGDDDRAAAIGREVAAVRGNVGVIDVSTLGKIEIAGPDAAEFLNRMYTFAYAKQPVGKTRYLLMTGETGAIIDDGVACRRDDEAFYVTTTSTGIDQVYRSMLRWNAEWRLAVTLSNVTAAYAAVNLAGPRAREVLDALGTDVETGPEAFPYLAYREGRVAGVPARLLRVGFVGELGYEIHVPAEYGTAVWQRLLECGAAFGLMPFGVEAQRVLRLEKGHLIVGQDTDGLTIPHEAGMAWAVAERKPFFVGKRAVEVIARRGIVRRLVGFRMPASAPCPQENELVIRDGEIAGRVTSAARSEAAGGIVGLAYLPPDAGEPGTGFDIKLASGVTVEATVAATPFYDPDGARQAL